MRPGQNNKRMRGRPNNRKGPNPLTRSYESSGPDVKIRGTAHHIGEKYLQLARDAQSSGDPVMAESYLQHAEHYFRLIATAQQAQQQSSNPYQRQPGDGGVDDIEDGDDFEGLPDRFASPLERQNAQPQHFMPQPAPSGQPSSADRPFYGHQDRQQQGFERPDRGPRHERPFQERAYSERNSSDRGGADRGDRGGLSREGAGRDQDGRGQRRGPREFRNESAPRVEPREEMRAPTEEIEQPGLPAFITAPVRATSDSLEPVSSVEAFASGEQPDVEREPNGFPLRPRRRRRGKVEMAHQGPESDDIIANDPVGD